MLSLHGSREKPFTDLSAELFDELDWKAGTLRTLIHHLDISAFAYEPVSGLLAVGNSKGIIDIYGNQSRGVEHRVELSEPLRIRSLHFASSLFRLVAIDEHDRLTAWDLNTPGKPKLQSIVSFRHPVNCITLSPSHSHVFVALSNGEIQTYDLQCSRLSSYKCPNMWKLYEEKVIARGMSSTAGAGSRFPIQLVIHPRDLNRLFVAYGGGVTLIDLTQRNTERAYEYVLPPGAPGGAGYHDQDLLKHRRPEVTAIAIHPAGHTFAVGYTDGSIAFWAVEDEDKPLYTLTLDGQYDVHIVDADRLDTMLARPKQPSDGPREPIFKLAWSGFPNSPDTRGGDTVLTVLGGLRSDETPGITVLLLPPFNPPEPQAQVPGSTMLDHATRAAMRETVIPIKSHVYTTDGIPQDFLLLPRESPHFDGAWDPAAILLLSDGHKDARALEAYQFPPPGFILPPDSAPVSPQSPLDATNASVAHDIASALESMKLSDDPKCLRVPPALWSGPNGVVSGHLMALDREAYEVLTLSHAARIDDAISLRGGSAWGDDSAGEMKLMKFQPHRILITHHADLTVRFRDLNAQLLVSSDTTPMQASFPNPLPELTIDLVSLLADPVVATRTSPDFTRTARVVSSHLAPQSLECAVALQDGSVGVYRLTSGASGELPLPSDLMDQELVSVTHVSTSEGRRFRPYFMVLSGRGPVSALTICDIGFLAISHMDGSLYVIDMRGPRVIMRSLPDEGGLRRSFLHRHEADPVQSLTFTVAGTDADPQLRVLLIAVRASSSTTVYSLLRTPDGMWNVSPTPDTTDTVSQPLPGASFVIDSRSGNLCRANRGSLGAALSASIEDVQRGKAFWVCAGVKGVRCVVDITGERIGRAEWPSKFGKVDSVSVVQKNGATVLVAHTDRREAIVYSLPYLQHMHSLQIHQTSQELLSLDETGDYVEWLRHPCGLIHTEKYGTLFDVRRSNPYEAPHVDFTYSRGTVPPQPQPVSIGPASLLSSVWGYIANQGVTGDQVDVLLGGPDRPVPQPKPQPQRRETTSTRTSPGSNASGASTSAQNLANNASSGVSNLYSRLNDALSERGEMLGNLQESFQSLESGSKNMLSQAKNLAMKQGAKRWFQLS